MHLSSPCKRLCLAGKQPSRSVRPRTATAPPMKPQVQTLPKARPLDHERMIFKWMLKTPRTLMLTRRQWSRTICAKIPGNLSADRTAPQTPQAPPAPSHDTCGAQQFAADKVFGIYEFCEDVLQGLSAWHLFKMRGINKSVAATMRYCKKLRMN